MTDVKLLRLTTGEDVVAEVTFSDDVTTTIKKPFVLIPMAKNQSSGEETRLFFSPFIPFAENEEMIISDGIGSYQNIFSGFDGVGYTYD